MWSPPPPLSMELHDDGAGVRVTARGELDIATVADFEEALARCREHGRDVLLDLADLEFIDSTGIRAVLSAVTIAKSDGWNLGIAAEMASPIRRAFEVTGVLAALPVIEQ